MKKIIQSYFEDLQNQICSELETQEPSVKFTEDYFTRPEGGFGKTRIISDGKTFEKGGVAFSAVEGELPPSIAERMNLKNETFFATGVSLVIHPLNPFVPTTHANFRYFETSSGKWWFGGGADLTPFYPFDEDIIHFHQTLKNACDLHDPEYYKKFKKWCDDYFFIRHRNENRGVGGIFFDYLNSDKAENFKFVKTVSQSFAKAYIPIVSKRKELPFGKMEQDFQWYRRGRYVEFNLVYDKGTLFGLETNGRIESILMSLPPKVSWIYDFQPEENSREAKLKDYLKPKEWLK